MCIHVCVMTRGDQKRMSDSWELVQRVVSNHVLETNSGVLLEQQVFLTTEHLSSPQFMGFKLLAFLCDVILCGLAWNDTISFYSLLF